MLNEGSLNEFAHLVAPRLKKTIVRDNSEQNIYGTNYRKMINQSQRYIEH